jgi:phosphatidylserine decarboxylase
MMSGMVAAWREVRSIVLGLAGVTMLAGLARRRWLAAIGATILGWVFYFFRDPERSPAASGAEWILAPADGRVTAIEWVDEPFFFRGPARRISVFLSIFDVHVQRSPYQGMIELVRYQPGSYAPAFFQDPQSNESNLIGLATPQGPVGVKQIAGILARRIICWPQVGDGLERGERLGLIKFGSRVDLLLPPEVEVVVHIGQQVYGGQTVMGRWPIEVR